MNVLSTPRRRIVLMLLTGAALAAAIRMTDRTGDAPGEAGTAPPTRPASGVAHAAAAPGRRAPYAGDFRDPFVWQARPETVAATATDTSAGRSPPSDTLRPPALRLIGVIDGTAFLQPPDGELHVVAVGEQLAGLRVVQVRPDHVLAEYAGRTVTLALDD